MADATTIYIQDALPGEIIGRFYEGTESPDQRFTMIAIRLGHVELKLFGTARELVELGNGIATEAQRIGALEADALRVTV